MVTVYQVENVTRSGSGSGSGPTSVSVTVTDSYGQDYNCPYAIVSCTRLIMLHARRNSVNEAIRAMLNNHAVSP